MAMASFVYKLMLIIIKKYENINIILYCHVGITSNFEIFEVNRKQALLNE